MAMAERFTVGSSSVLLEGSEVAGRTLVITNVGGSNSADIGGASNVTDGGGFPLSPGASVTVHLDPQDVLYAVSSAGTDLAVLYA